MFKKLFEMNVKFIIVNVFNDLRNEIQEDPLRNLVLRYNFFKFRAYKFIIRLNYFDQFKNHGKYLLSLFVIKRSIAIQIKHFNTIN